MSEKRLAGKVGLFVFIGLALIAALLLNFSKGASFFHKTYKVHVLSSDVGGIKAQAGVSMSGVKIGTVTTVELSNDSALLKDVKTPPEFPTNSYVIISITIFAKYKVPSNSTFSIDSLGFLGDQFVSIRPPLTNQLGSPLTDGAIVVCEAPFDFQKQVHNISTAVESAKGAITNLNHTIDNVNQNVLNEKTSRSFTQTLSNFNQMSEHSVSVVSNMNALVKSNTAKIDNAFEKLNQFSSKLNDIGEQLTNSIVPDVKLAVHDFRNAAQTATNILGDVQQGKGVVGDLLKNEDLKMQLAGVVTNLNAVSGNLAVTTSNLNQRGLWGILWKNKESKKEKIESRSTPFPSGKNR